MNKKIPVVELFASIQGEGMASGRPTIFIRFSGCNLRCMFNNSICDTSYTSFNPEKGKYSLLDVKNFIQDHSYITDICITGGCPFLYTDIVSKVCDIIEQCGKYFVSVETNGTIEIPDEIFEKIDFFVISPKLSSSEPTKMKCDKVGIEFTESMKRHSSLRFNPKALEKIIKNAFDYHFKYVIGSQSDFEEIEEQIAYLKQLNLDIHNFNIYLMPAGSTQEELSQNRKMVAEYCVKYGYNYSDRLQIVIWNTEKER